MTDTTDDRTQEQADHDAREGRAIGLGFMIALEAVPVPVCYNVLGTMAETIFESIEFEKPGDMLIEFDNWAKYTRERLAETVKERLS
jgi:hypothetical protein